MAIRATLLLALLACSSAPTAQPAASNDAAAAPQPSTAEACLDKETDKRGLNKYGDPKDTMYPGGTPLFHEATGKRTDRMTYMQEHHPEIAAACTAP